MRFPFPCFPAEFEIPDDWWREAGMDGFVPASPMFHSTPDVEGVLLREIEPPVRYPQCPKDFHGFDRSRFVSILRGIVSGAEIPAVPLLTLVVPDEEVRRPPFGYRVENGFHRFYASVAAGYEKLPAVIL